MARSKKAAVTLTPEEKLQQALVPVEDQPYEVPENWCWTKIGNLTSLHRGVSYKKNDAHTEKLENDCLIMRGGNIGEGYIDTDADNVYVNRSLVGQDQIVRKNDIIIVASTGSTKVIGRAGISQMDYTDVAFGAFLMLVRPLCKLNQRYVDYFFQSDNYRNRIRDLASGVNINNIRADYINETPAPLPPLAEQQRIVDRIESIFAKLDEAKEKAQAVVDGFELRKSAILHKAFTGELTAQWRQEHQSYVNSMLSDIKTYASNWQKKDIKFLEKEQSKAEIITFENGHQWIKCTIGAISRVTNGSTPSRKNDEYWKGNIPWISSGEVRNNIIGASNECITELGYENSSVKFLPVGTVLIAMIGEGKTRGQSAVLDIEATINQNIAAVVVDHGLVASHYVWYWFQMNYAKNREKGAGSGPQALNCQRVRELDFFVPNIEEQKEIIRLLDDFMLKEQQAKNAAEVVIDQIDTMKKAVLARAFRGELRTNDPAEKSAMELLKSVL